jgi:hypothetical protein
MVYGHNQAECLFDEDTVAIHIDINREIPLDADTITRKPWVQELGGVHRVIGFLLAKQDTAATRVVSIVMVLVMVVPIAPAQDSCEQEKTDPASPPPASASHP